jgi:hypothetical protein
LLGSAPFAGYWFGDFWVLEVAVTVTTLSVAIDEASLLKVGDEFAKLW